MWTGTKTMETPKDSFWHCAGGFASSTYIDLSSLYSCITYIQTLAFYVIKCQSLYVSYAGVNVLSPPRVGIIRHTSGVANYSSCQSTSMPNPWSISYQPSPHNPPAGSANAPHQPCGIVRIFIHQAKTGKSLRGSPCSANPLPSPT